MSTHSHQECLAARAGNLRRYGLNASDRPRAVSLVTLLVPSRASSLEPEQPRSECPQPLATARVCRSTRQTTSSSYGADRVMWVGRTRQSSGVISKESCYSASVSKTPASASQPQSKPHLKAISATISAVTDCLCRDHTCHGLSGRSPPSFANQAWLDVVRSSDASGMQDCDSSTVAKEGTHTPEKHERPGQRPGRASVELRGIEP
jgi:hypothetical protein